MDTSPQQPALSLCSRVLKRTLDLTCSVCGLLIFGWAIGLAWVVMSLETKEPGFFAQERVGRNGKLFKVIKIRTMRSTESENTTVTIAHDTRITRIGKFLRKYKIDELPQLINVVKGEMSLIGPRPDVPGFADKLTGMDRTILSVRPGISGVASLAFRSEEELLANQPDPETYNAEVVYPEKTRLNLIYIAQYSVIRDIGYILESITGVKFVKNDGR